MKKRVLLLMTSILLCVSNIVAATLEVTIGESKWRTFYIPVNVQIPEGVEAYVVASVSDGYVNLNKIEGDVIAAATPVLLNAAAGIYEFVIAGVAAEVGNNLLVGTSASNYVTISSDCNYYVFDEDKCAWFPAVEVDGMENCFLAEAGKAYLEVPAIMAESSPYLFIEGATATLASGICGENLTWKLTAEGELIIEGTGTMTNYEEHSAPWFAYKDDILAVTIKPGVTTIGNYAVGNCSKLTTVTLPEGITSIGIQAFQYCDKLTSLTLQAGLTTIGWGSFSGCNNLTVTLPEGLKEIGNYAFTDCKLGSIIMPESLTEIGMYAFRSCDLTSIVCKAVTPPSMLAGYGGDPFQDVNKNIPVYVPYSSLEAYKTADCWTGFTNIQPMGICGNNLTWRLTPENELIVEGTGEITSTPWSIYSEQVSTVTLGEGVANIRDWAFGYYPNLTSVAIPASVTTIGGYAFMSCSSLASVTIAENSQLATIGASTFKECSNLTSFTLPASVTAIEGDAFWRTGLTSFIIPENSQLATIGDWAFHESAGLATISFPASLTSIGYFAFYSCNFTSITCNAVTPPSAGNAFPSTDASALIYVPAVAVDAYKEADGWSAFTNIQPIIIDSGTCGDNLTWKYLDGDELVIEGTGDMYNYSNNPAAPWSSYRGSIKSVNIKDGVTSIGSWAFAQCSALTDVSISESVITIGGDAFRECCVLEEITLPAGLTQLGTGVFLYCDALKSITVPEGMTIIGSDTFEFCPNLNSITFPSSLTEIGPWALKGAYNLASITCKATTPPSIGSSAFSGVNSNIPVYVPTASVETYKTADGWSRFTNIQPIIIASGTCGDNLTWKLIDGGELVIEGAGAMNSGESWSQYKDAIKKVTIMEGVTSICDWAFHQFPNLATVTVPASVTTISRAFEGCSSLSSFTIAEGSKLTHIGAYTFATCTSLASFTIPEGMTILDGWVFASCNSLTSVVFPESMTEIGDYSFTNCENLASITIPKNVTIIGQYAFNACYSLNTITSYASAPPALEGETVFNGVDRNIPVYVPYSAVEAYKTADYWKEFANILPMGTCGDNLTWKLTVEGELIIEGTGAMTGAPWSAFRESVKKITIKEGVTSICDNAFRDYNKVVTVTIPKGITTAGMEPFWGCTGEVYLNSIPESLDGMMMGGFLFGGNFTKVIVGGNVTEIKDMAFFYLPNLVEVVLPENLTRIGEMAFAECQNLTTITIPANVTSVGRYAFDYCTRLTSVVCKGVIPPVCDGEFSWNPEQELVLYVPFATISTYQSADYWKNFDYVVGTTGCGEELTCELWPNGKLIISGEGVITDTPWEGYEELVRTLVIAEGVTGFADEVFADFSSLETITSYAVTPPVCGTNVFAGVDRTAPVYVPIDGIEAYRMAEGWSEFVYLGSTDSRFLLDSFAEYVQAEDEELEEITYVRNFNNTEWQALYVPFEIPVTEEFLAEFEVADLNDIRQYDRDDDGVADETVVEAFKVTNGVLKANYPYLIRAKEIGEKNITVTDATLYATEENSIDCSSIHEKYIFSGTYNTMDAAALVGCYALSSGVWQPIADDASLGAFRFYLNIESRDGNMQAARNIRMRVIGKDTGDGTTAIDNISDAEKQDSEIIYDLQGRPVTNPNKGIYIVNGKKVLFE